MPSRRCFSQQFWQCTLSDEKYPVPSKNVMPVSISFQFLSALQKLEQLRETMPQLPRIHFVEPFAHRSIRRHATDTVQRLSTEPPHQNARHRRTSEEMGTSCRTPPSPSNPSDSAPGSSMRSKQARTSFNRALSVLRMPGIFAVQSCPALRVDSRRDFPREKANSPESSRKVYENFFFRLYIFQRVRALAGIAAKNAGMNKSEYS